MKFLPSLTAAAALAGLLTACHSTTAADAPATAAPAANYLKVNFDGQTRTYPDATFSAAQLGTLQSLEITAGSEAGGYLTISLAGGHAGTYPYRPTMSQYAGVSQVEYRAGGTVYNHYKARVCPTTAGYYATPGQVVITSYVPGQQLRGTFSGSLLDQNDPDQCSTQGKRFSGEFALTSH